MSEETRVRKLLAANLKRFREYRGWSQMVLAQVAGTHQNVINEIEHCRRWVSPEKLEDLCTALGIEPYQLLVPLEMQSLTKDEAVSRLVAELKSKFADFID